VNSNHIIVPPVVCVRVRVCVCVCERGCLSSKEAPSLMGFDGKVLGRMFGPNGVAENCTVWGSCLVLFIPVECVRWPAFV
jgi:hypothetical protein